MDKHENRWSNIASISWQLSRSSYAFIIIVCPAISPIYLRPHFFYSSYLPSPTTPSPGMQMYCQSPNYIVCPNNSIYPSDQSSPPPAHPIAPHTPHSVSLLPQLGQVCTNNLFVSDVPLPSPPSSSSGTVSSGGSSPHSSPTDNFVGEDYPYPYISYVEPQQCVFHPLNLS